MGNRRDNEDGGPKITYQRSLASRLFAYIAISSFLSPILAAMVRIFPAWIALSGLALVMADTKRTPEDFDWNSLTCPSQVAFG